MLDGFLEQSFGNCWQRQVTRQFNNEYVFGKTGRRPNRCGHSSADSHAVKILDGDSEKQRWMMHNLKPSLNSFSTHTNHYPSAFSIQSNPSHMAVFVSCPAQILFLETFSQKHCLYPGLRLSSWVVTPQRIHRHSVTTWDNIPTRVFVRYPLDQHLGFKSLKVPASS